MCDGAMVVSFGLLKVLVWTEEDALICFVRWCLFRAFESLEIDAGGCARLFRAMVAAFGLLRVLQWTEDALICFVRWRLFRAFVSLEIVKSTQEGAPLASAVSKDEMFLEFFRGEVDGGRAV